MPEAPELEVIKDFLKGHLLGAEVVGARVLRPSVLRPLAADVPTDMPRRTVDEVWRNAKFLVIRLSGGRRLVVNPMLTGRFQYCDPSARLFKRTCLVVAMSTGKELRYLDDRQMGRVYYVDQDGLDEIPQFSELGPDALDLITFEEFQRRLSRFHGEIKGILTRGRVVSGIGNAYADEILFAARIYPFRRRKALSEDDLRRLHDKTRSVMEEATDEVRRRMGGDIHLKPRDFLKVHNKGGDPCPRCGAKITQLTANQRITSYCRRCQPGLLIKT